MDPKPLRRATITKTIKGKFTTWRAGQVVNTRHVAGSSYMVERVKLVGKGKLPLLNQCSGIPRSYLQFNEPATGRLTRRHKKANSNP